MFTFLLSTLCKVREVNDEVLIKEFITRVFDYYEHSNRVDANPAAIHGDAVQPLLRGLEYNGVVQRGIYEAKKVFDVPMYMTGSRSQMSDFNNNFYTLDSDYDVTLLLGYTPHWLQRVTRALYAYSNQDNCISYENTQYPWDAKTASFGQCVDKSQPTNWLSSDDPRLGWAEPTTGALLSATPWGEIIIHRSDFLQIKFNANNHICAAKFDLTIYAQASTWVWRLNQYHLLEYSLSAFRNRMANRYVSQTVFDLYIRTLKAIRPEGLSSIRMITMGAASLQLLSMEIDANPGAFRDCFNINSTIPESLRMLLEKFFAFCVQFFNEGHGNWRQYNILLQWDGSIWFPSVIPPKADFKSKPEAYFVSHKGQVSDNVLRNMGPEIRNMYQHDLRLMTGFHADNTNMLTVGVFLEQLLATIEKRTEEGMDCLQPDMWFNTVQTALAQSQQVVIQYNNQSLARTSDVIMTTNLGCEQEAVQQVENVVKEQSPKVRSEPEENVHEPTVPESFIAAQHEGRNSPPPGFWDVGNMKERFDASQPEGRNSPPPTFWEIGSKMTETHSNRSLEWMFPATIPAFGRDDPNTSKPDDSQSNTSSSGSDGSPRSETPVGRDEPVPEFSLEGEKSERKKKSKKSKQKVGKKDESIKTNARKKSTEKKEVPKLTKSWVDILASNSKKKADEPKTKQSDFREKVLNNVKQKQQAAREEMAKEEKKVVKPIPKTILVRNPQPEQKLRETIQKQEGTEAKDGWQVVSGKGAGKLSAADLRVGATTNLIEVVAQSTPNHDGSINADIKITTSKSLPELSTSTAFTMGIMSNSTNTTGSGRKKSKKKKRKGKAADDSHCKHEKCAGLDAYLNDEEFHQAVQEHQKAQEIQTSHSKKLVVTPAKSQLSPKQESSSGNDKLIPPWDTTRNKGKSYEVELRKLFQEGNANKTFEFLVEATSFDGDWFCKDIPPQEKYSPENLFIWAMNEKHYDLARFLQEAFEKYGFRKMKKKQQEKFDLYWFNFDISDPLTSAFKRKDYVKLLCIIRDSVENYDTSGRWHEQLNFPDPYSFEGIFHAMMVYSGQEPCKKCSEKRTQNFLGCSQCWSELQRVAKNGFFPTSPDAIRRLNVATAAFGARRKIYNTAGLNADPIQSYPEPSVASYFILNLKMSSKNLWSITPNAELSPEHMFLWAVQYWSFDQGIFDTTLRNLLSTLLRSGVDPNRWSGTVIETRLNELRDKDMMLDMIFGQYGHFRGPVQTDYNKFLQQKSKLFC